VDVVSRSSSFALQWKSALGLAMANIMAACDRERCLVDGQATVAQIGVKFRIIDRWVDDIIQVLRGSLY
jgi:hypothetical protein